MNPGRDLSFFVHVGLEAHALAGGVDRLQHRREHLVAVDEHVVLVAVHKVGCDQRRQILGGAVVFRCNRAPQLHRLLVLCDGQAGGDGDRRDDQDSDGNAQDA